MESRLRRPQISTKNTVTTGMSISSSASCISKSSQNLTKAKSTHNINAKPKNENEPPNKTGLIRAKTISTFNRVNGTTSTNVKTAVKRPGTASSEIDAKKPNVKGTTNSIVRTVNTRPPKSASRKSTTIVAKHVPAKPSRWDTKGRLALTSEKLATMKEKNDELVARNKELAELVETLKEQENASRVKAEKYEILSNNLTQELETLTVELTELRTKNKNLDEKLEDTEKSLQETVANLKTFRTKCNIYETKLLEHESQTTELQSNLELQRNMVTKLTITKQDLQSLIHGMDKELRILHNAIQELKGNIRVFCRVRPRIPKESAKGLCTINFPDECTIEIGRMDNSEVSNCGGKVRGSRIEFSFDKVFSPSATQADIFEELALLVQSALEGYNVCVFAYGQTGSGKTYTMEGGFGIEAEGMIPRTVRHIFKEMKQFELIGWEYRIEASFLEIYNEHIVDLLDSQTKVHEIRMADAKGTDVYVSNLSVQEIHSPEELQEYLRIAQENRAVAATQANERSSRSHSVARIRLIGTHTLKDEVCIGNLNLVDLAGSERLKTEEAVRTAETKNINKSLANLGNVILALLKKQEHVPYRNSKLTHLLMPSLGGNSKTLMLLNVSPLDECYNETMNSLRFASNVNSCKTGNVKRTRTITYNPAS
ncbi:protein claret segregational [Cephus cinctus]|uniref:Protein claret segregational n=1 Tax=Cephus cinctus TaxID=211228 RepID=A0AAJ7FS27_CEPCN|nr:protein claret segregational [Cephus cinctus]XP_015605450.1 protein claret segregational [Cephus cinctus]